MYSPAVGPACSAAVASAAMSNQTLCVGSVTTGLRRHSSANQFIFMQTTIATSNAGQLKPGTTRGAANSMATATPIFTVSQNMNRNIAAPAAAGVLARFRVMPRASKALGTTTTAAPYSADKAAPLRCVKAQTMAQHSSPATACTATTRHGDKGGLFFLQ